jgi:hypothetical protein
MHNILVHQMRKLLKNKNFLHLILGFLVASTFYLYAEYKYEEKTQEAFINSIYSEKSLSKSNNEAVILATMQKTHLQLKQNEITAMGLQLNPIEEMLTSPLMQFALTKDGACGGNSLVLAQLLQGMGYEVRTGQMMVNNKFGGHIILEVKNNDKWVVLDPLYNLSFRNDKGDLASFDELHNNWAYYEKQVPVHYNKSYKYSGLQHTNWAKIPVLGQLLYNCLKIIKGESYAKGFCLRNQLLQPKKLMFFFAIYLLGFSVISILNKRYIKFSLSSFLSFKAKYSTGSVAVN